MSRVRWLATALQTAKTSGTTVSTRALRRACDPCARRSARAAARSRSTDAASSSVAATGPPRWAAADNACTVSARSASSRDDHAESGDQRASLGQPIHDSTERRGAIDLVDHRAGQARTAANPTCDRIEQRGVVGLRAGVTAWLRRIEVASAAASSRECARPTARRSTQQAIQLHSRATSLSSAPSRQWGDHGSAARPTDAVARPWTPDRPRTPRRLLVRCRRICRRESRHRWIGEPGREWPRAASREPPAAPASTARAIASSAELACTVDIEPS